MVKSKKGKVSLLVIVLTIAMLVSVASAQSEIQIYVDGVRLQAEPQAVMMENSIYVPIRAIAEQWGAEVVWEYETRSVHIDSSYEDEKTSLLDEVKAWVQQQGEYDPYYYLDGLSYELVNIDQDDELEIFAKIDSAVHLGHFFIFDQKEDGQFALVYEQGWHVLSWNIVPTFRDLDVPMYEIVTRTGGTGVDVREAHLMYLQDGQWTEVWQGILKERSIFQDEMFLTMGSYEINDDDGSLMYWQTEINRSLKEGERLDGGMDLEAAKTTVSEYRWKDGQFYKK